MEQIFIYRNARLEQPRVFTREEPDVWTDEKGDYVHEHMNLALETLYLEVTE